MKVVHIFEGIDHTGKSTAAKLLADTAYSKYDKTTEIFHVDSKHPNDFKFYDEILDEFHNDNISDIFIFDRAMIGELVYGPLWRKKSRISLYNIHSLFKRYANMTFIINVNYVDYDNLDKYLTCLIERDKLENTMSPQKAKDMIEQAWIEQCMFRNVIDAVKLMDLPNVIINEDKFIPGGKNETI